MRKAYRLKNLILFIIPCFVCFLIAFIIPFISGIILSFFKWNSTILNAKFVFIDNYKNIFSDIHFRNSFIFTFVFSIFSVISINLFAFIIAILLTRKNKYNNIFRTIFFMPNLIGGVILGFIWQVIINALFYKFNMSIGSNEKLGFISLLIIMNWQLIGYMMIIYIAGVNGVNKDLIDASSVDGASFMQKLKYVIIPSIMPSITICLFLTITNSFKLFDANFALTSGGPNRRTEMLALNIVYTIFNERKPGVGLSKSVVFFLIIGLISLIQVRITKSKEVEL